MSEGLAHTCIQCLVGVARRHGVDLSAEQLVHDFALDAEPSLDQLVAIAEARGLQARRAELDWERLRALGEALPVVAFLKNGNGVIVVGPAPDVEDEIVVLDPLSGSAAPLRIARERFERAWAGAVVFVRRKRRLLQDDGRFDLRWFLREVLRRRQAFIDVAIAVVGLNLIALATPIFFQIVVDRVLVHQIQATLVVLSIGVVAAVVFEGLLTFLRGFILLHATRKIDMRVSTLTFAHLASLPASFFQSRTAGVLSKHMQQTAQIREFLTGQALMTLLDLTILFVFLPVLLLYSPTLTLVVFGFTALIAGVIAAMLGPFRERLQTLYVAEAQRQSHLVETIHGMGTIKALALEPEQKRLWEEVSADVVRRSADVGGIAIATRSLAQTLERLMSIAIIVVGVFLVFEGTLSIGALIAFQMLSGRVSGPLVQVVSLVHQYQETSIAVRMLGEIMNAPPERPADARGLRPKIEGAIQFANVSFTYPNAPSPVVQAMSFDIRKGSSIGVVGRSGSGKTTLSRLIQGLHPAQTGAVRLDGVDLREIDLAHLRSHIGVVLQESFLFRGSVRENIARTKPDATFEEIVAASRIAGAHGFIEEQPQGYDTFLEEGATNLSGGQRQRLAIARALLRDPPVLILDEATSALDPESEAVIQTNLAEIMRSRTTIIISHRLSMLRDVDEIFVVDRGRLVDRGPHRVLVARDGIYRSLWRSQMEQVR